MNEINRILLELIGEDDTWNGDLKAMEVRVAVRNGLRHDLRKQLSEAATKIKKIMTDAIPEKIDKASVGSISEALDPIKDGEIQASEEDFATGYNRAVQDIKTNLNLEGEKNG